jgi:hypothetical protein
LKVTEGAFLNTDTTDSSASDMEVADIDDDGDLDIFITNDGNNTMFVNEASGSLRKIKEGTFVTDGGSSIDVEVADMDGDGDLDILVANQDFDSRRINQVYNAMYMNEGGGELRKVTEGDFVVLNCGTKFSL